MVVRSILAFSCLLVGLALGQRLFQSPAYAPKPVAAEADLNGTILSASNPLASLRSSQQETVVAGATAKSVSDTSRVASLEAGAPQAQVAVEAETRPWTMTVTSLADNARRTMTRDLQGELRRLGCYSGPVDGRWSGDVVASLRVFTGAVNAALPVDNPDYALLALARSHQPGVCDPTASPAAITAEADPSSATAPGADGAYIYAPAGRMSLGASQGGSRGTVPEKAPTRRPRMTEVERLFIHPLGQ
jgi:hypothetical protein